MRKMRRARIGFSLVLASAAFGGWVAACSGDDSSSDTPAAPDAARVEASVPPNSLPDTSVADVVLDVVQDTGTIYDAGPANVLEAGDEYEGGVPCVVGGQLEEEPNDDPDAANTLAPTRCGAILLTADGGTGSPTIAESDFLTFTLPTTTNTFFIQFSGDVSLKVDVEGNPSVTITPTTSAAVPFVKGKPYFIEVRSLNGKKAFWRVTVFQS
jgi:hypothetical protein